MDTTMHLMARSVQLAVITAPTSSLPEAVASARGRRESFAALIRRAIGVTGRSPIIGWCRRRDLNPVAECGGYTCS